MRPISLPAHRVGVVILEQMELVVSAPAAQRERGQPVAQHKNVRVKHANREQVVGIALLANRGHIVRAAAQHTILVPEQPVIRDGRAYMALRRWKKDVIVVR